MDSILEKINQAGLVLLESITPEETYRSVVNEAIKLVEAEHGSIFLRKENSEDLLIRVYASDPFFYKIKHRRKGNVETAFRENKLVINNAAHVAKIHPIVKDKGIKSIILIPLTFRGDSIGVLAVHSLKKEHFTKKQIDVLRIFGSMSTLAIKKSQLYSETKKALEIRDMFISMAAHELRTPITSISGYIQLLHSKLGKQDTSEGKWVQALYDENKRLTSLVRELLEVNRLRAGQLQFKWQECILPTIVNQAVDEVQQRFPHRIINFKNALNDEGTVIGDNEKLLKVFDNVIDNALKYSANETNVDVALVKKNRFYLIKILDKGKGIDEADLPHIFSGQHKGESGEEGMGIGLLFVENIVRQHRGSIDVKSKLKKGTTIEIKIPAAKYGR